VVHKACRSSWDGFGAKSSLGCSHRKVLTPFEWSNRLQHPKSSCSSPSPFTATSNTSTSKNTGCHSEFGERTEPRKPMISPPHFLAGVEYLWTTDFSSQILWFRLLFPPLDGMILNLLIWSQSMNLWQTYTPLCTAQTIWRDNSGSLTGFSTHVIRYKSLFCFVFVQGIINYHYYFRPVLFKSTISNVVWMIFEMMFTTFLLCKHSIFKPNFHKIWFDKILASVDFEGRPLIYCTRIENYFIYHNPTLFCDLVYIVENHLMCHFPTFNFRRSTF